MPDTFLGFDYGERHIGVAVGDSETRLAHPVGHIDAKREELRLERIGDLVREWRPSRMVVGLPLSLQGAEHLMTGRARRFGRRLQAHFGIPVEFADERLSSTAAEEMLKNEGRGARRHKHEAHALAAQIILQAYLDEGRAAERRP